MSTRYPKYQDYVIQNGRLIGEFEQMYKDHIDPWNQSVREVYSSEKAAGINLINRLHEVEKITKVVELGCGFGDYSARIHELGLNVTGIDISQTAIEKAKKRHGNLNNVASANLEFDVAKFDDFTKLKLLQPDLIVMPEITWYVLDQLKEFKCFLKNELPNCYLLHMLMTYKPGEQVYGREYFTNLEEIMKYFGMYYLESGLVNIAAGGTRTWFLGTWNVVKLSEWTQS